MPIPASHIVDVQPRVITGGSADLELNGLLIATYSTISATDVVIEFTSLDSVARYFGYDSDIYAAAIPYFTSYTNKFVAPRRLYVARRISTPVAGWLRGGSVDMTEAQLKSITNGAMVVSIDGQAVTVTNVSFASANSYSAVATALQAALAGKVSGTTVTYSSLFNAFTITSPTTGSTSSVSFAAAGTAGTNLAAVLKLTAASGAITSAGSAALTPGEQMEAIRRKTQNFVTFTTSWMAPTAEALQWAAWARDNYGWLYVPYSDAADMISTGTSDMASSLKNGNYDHTAVIYGTLEYAMFLMGSIASIPWYRVNGTITLAFKRQPALAAMVTDEATANILEGKNCNYYGNFATRNAAFQFIYPGVMSASDYGYIDPYINSIWLNNRLQVALLDGLTSVGRVPYNDRGYTMIKAWMMDPINEAKINATVEAGVVLSERQKSEVANEAGLDISGELFTQGYYIQILDPGAAVRVQRGSPIVSLWYCYAGAVQKIEVASTAIL